MNYRIYFSILFTLVTAATAMMAQGKAESLFMKKGYRAAAEIDALSQSTDKTTLMRLAESYRLSGDSEAAEYYYSKFVNESTEALPALRYAQALLSNGKCKEAVAAYNKFASLADEKTKAGISFIKDCNEIRSLKSAGEIKLTNISTLNSGVLDFSPIMTGQKVVFSSTRGASKQCNDKWTNQNYTDLFTAEPDKDGAFKNVKPLIGEANSKYHDCVATFADGGKTMYFTRSRNKSAGFIDYKIFKATEQNGVYINLTELPFNSNSFATGHPTLSSDGKKMYFSSNRPGGFGGMDLYVSQAIGGLWQAPVNLGPTVNTAGNEVFPYIAVDDKLYFSSDAHKGLGGLDVFCSKRTDASNWTSWDAPKNMGAPMNSAKDDFGFSTNIDATKGFLSTNRNGGNGGDDIYAWELTGIRPIEPTIITKKVSVVDAISQIGISQPTITIAGANLLPTPVVQDFVEIEIDPNAQYTIKAEKAGYQPRQVVVSGLVLSKVPEYKVPLDKIMEAAKPTRTTLTGNVKNRQSGVLLPDAQVYVKNSCSGTITELRTNGSGTFSMEADCNCNYEVSASKTGFSTGKTTVYQLNCASPSTAVVELDANVVAPAPVVVPAPAPVQAAPAPVATFEGSTLEVGKAIQIRDIYYDYDKSYIRPDAGMRLDRVVALMQQYPGLDLELSSHTDSRGNNDYNQRLSQRRAEEAVAYIVSKGISSSRLEARGYGETSLLNQCADGVKCNEQDHQMNRRTEIRVLRFDNAGVRVDTGR